AGCPANDPALGTATINGGATGIPHFSFAMKVAVGWNVYIASPDNTFQDFPSDCDGVRRTLDPSRYPAITLTQHDVAAPVTIPITDAAQLATDATAAFTDASIAYPSGSVTLTRVSGTIDGTFDAMAASASISGSVANAPYCP